MAELSKDKVAPGQIWQAPGKDNEPGFRRVRVVAKYPTGDEWVIEELPAKISTFSGRLSIIPDYNLRYVFSLEEGYRYTLNVDLHRNNVAGASEVIRIDIPGDYHVVVEYLDTRDVVIVDFVYPDNVRHRIENIDVKGK